MNSLNNQLKIRENTLFEFKDNYDIKNYNIMNGKIQIIVLNIL